MSPMGERAPKRPRHLPMAGIPYDSHGILSTASCQVPQACSIPSDARRSKVQRQRLCHPITPPPSTPPSPGSQHAMTVTLPKKSMQSVISRVVPDATVRDVQPLPSLRSQRLFDVQISDGSGLLLALPPPLMVKLLRSEQGSISSEAAVLRWLTDLGLDRPMLQERARDSVGSPESPPEKTLSAAAHRVDDPSPHLHTLLPILLAHSSSSNEFGIEYNVLRPPPGVPMTDIVPPLSPTERKVVDFRTGQFCRRLSKLVSPSGRFGPAFAVLPSWSPSVVPAPTSSASRNANARMSESKGVQSWSMAFHSMLEAVLRDGEDMAVMLGYSAVRRHFKRWEHTLDNVLTPRLVAVDAGNELNTMVVRYDKPPRRHNETEGSRFDAAPDTDDTDDEAQEDLFGDKTPIDEHVCCVDMTGMKDWSNFVFGDPLFAAVFSNTPSDELLSGFNALASVERHADSDDINSPESGPSLVEDEGTAPVRLLLYGAYHTITQIVKEFYRPQRDSGRRELAARKRLTHILAKLDEMSVESTPSGELQSHAMPPPRIQVSGESVPAKNKPE